jgi:hypothetical protein
MSDRLDAAAPRRLSVWLQLCSKPQWPSRCTTGIDRALWV